MVKDESHASFRDDAVDDGVLRSHVDVQVVVFGEGERVVDEVGASTLVFIVQVAVGKGVCE